MEQKTKLGFWSIVLLTINSIIGTGIFLSPGGVAMQYRLGRYGYRRYQDSIPDPGILR